MKKLLFRLILVFLAFLFIIFLFIFGSVFFDGEGHCLPLNIFCADPETKTLGISSESNSISPFPTEEVKLNTEPTVIMQKPNFVPSPIPSSISDPDPIITCNSKTGKLAVRLSICKSYTDCPDGKGGYIFESQESCKARWNRIGNDLKNVANDYSQSMQEQYNLQNQLNNQNSNSQIPDYTNNLPTGNYNGNLDFKLPPPQTPTPCPQTRTGEVIPCY